jgi:5-methylcytosine-specific restriction endonuclease McrA
MALKQCNKCSQLKDENQYYKNSRNPNRLNGTCKTCVSEKDKQRYQENKISIQEKVRVYYQENKEAVAAYNKKWRVENKERIHQVRKIYISQNRTKSQAACQRRRARIAGASGGHTHEEVQYLKEIQGFKCLMCKRPEPAIKLTLDHIVPLSKGGGNGIGNCQMLCKSCNSSKNDNYLDLRNQNQKVVKR